jgi:hypothetical protein
MEREINWIKNRIAKEQVPRRECAGNIFMLLLLEFVVTAPLIVTPFISIELAAVFLVIFVIFNVIILLVILSGEVTRVYLPRITHVGTSSRGLHIKIDGIEKRGLIIDWDELKLKKEKMMRGEPVFSIYLHDPELHSWRYLYLNWKTVDAINHNYYTLKMLGKI